MDISYAAIGGLSCVQVGMLKCPISWKGMTWLGLPQAGLHGLPRVAGGLPIGFAAYCFEDFRRMNKTILPRAACSGLTDCALEPLALRHAQSYRDAHAEDCVLSLLLGHTVDVQGSNKPMLRHVAHELARGSEGRIVHDRVSFIVG